MKVQRDPDAILAAWLEYGPTDLPDATRRAILFAIPTTPQSRRGSLTRRGSFQMTAFARLATASVLLVAAASAFVVIGQQAGPDSTSRPTDHPSPPSSQAPSAISAVTYASRQFGYSVEVPRTWRVTPASKPWPAGARLEADPAAVDRFQIDGSPVDAAVAVAAQPAPDGTTASTWLMEWERIREDIGGHCFGSATQWQETTVAGLPAWHIAWRCDSSLNEKSNRDEYTFLAGGMGYVISGTPSMVDLVVQSFRAP